MRGRTMAVNPVIKIIVVDDDEGYRALIREHLKPVKARFAQTWIVEFDNQEEALVEIEKNDVGLIITDMNLHDKYGPDGGVALMEAVSEGMQREYPFLLITGCEESDPSISEARKSTGCEIWNKAQPWETFTDKVLDIIGSTRLETRVKCLEDKMEKILVSNEKISGTVNDIKESHRELKESDDRMVAQWVVGLFFKDSWMKRIRASVGRKKEQAKVGLDAL
jgi:DNA-binding NtrC family response regulator